MKKTIILALLATTIAIPSAVAQPTQQDRNLRAYKQLVDQYATATLGFLIEDRCRQLAQVGYDDFLANQKILNEFMENLMGKVAWENMLVGVDQTAQDAETNPCNSDTFKFALATSQISSKMATRVQLLDPEDYPTPLEELPVASTQQSGPADNPPVQPEPEPQPEPVDNTPPPEPKTTFQTLTTTQLERQKVADKPKTQQTTTTSQAQTTPPPQTTTQSQPASTQAQTGISLSNYVNPFPYAAPAAPQAETEKEMKRRHRQEIIDLRRAQRAEMDAYKDNQDNYIDSKAVKKAIEQRQSAEYSAIRNRHQQELDRF